MKASEDELPEAEGEELPEEVGEDASEFEGEEDPDEVIEAEDELGEVSEDPDVVAADRRADDVEGFTDGSGFHPIRGSEGYKRTKAGDPRKKRARDESGRQRSGGGNYGDFAGSARDHSRAKDSVGAPDKTISQLNEFYRKAHGSKISPAEVK
jgi:hypothetical protein